MLRFDNPVGKHALIRRSRAHLLSYQSLSYRTVDPSDCLPSRVIARPAGLFPFHIPFDSAA